MAVILPITIPLDVMTERLSGRTANRSGTTVTASPMPREIATITIFSCLFKSTCDSILIPALITMPNMASIAPPRTGPGIASVALPILLGDNIGTTITAILAALAGSIAAKRAALVHVTFNIIGAVIFMILMPLFIIYVGYLEDFLSLNKPMTIAFAHGSYNIINTLIHLPFVGALAWLVVKIIPGRDFSEDFTPQHLDPLLLKQSPSIAIQGAQ